MASLKTKAQGPLIKDKERDQNQDPGKKNTIDKVEIAERESDGSPNTETATTTKAETTEITETIEIPEIREIPEIIETIGTIEKIGSIELTEITRNGIIGIKS